MELIIETKCNNKKLLVIILRYNSLIIFNHFLIIFNFSFFAFRTFALVIASIDQFDLVITLIISLKPYGDMPKEMVWDKFAYIGKDKYEMKIERRDH